MNLDAFQSTSDQFIADSQKVGLDFRIFSSLKNIYLTTLENQIDIFKFISGIDHT